MTDKRATKAKIRRLNQVKTWQLVILLLMSAFVSATFLRLNNVGMIERREAVNAADIEGDRATLERRLYDLQIYVSKHMNASPGRIALDKTYERDSQQRKDDYAKSIENQPQGDVYQQAEAVCGPQARAQGWRWPDARYTNCLDTELSKHPGATEMSNDFKPLPSEPYYQTFVSPLWSPDFAGWSVVLTGVIALIIVIRMIVLIVLKILVKRKYRQI
jgi:hypothetical protein